MNTQMMTTEVAIIGGGLAGLTAANFAARAGMNVILFEKAHAVGGRAATETSNGFHFNLGPHALYRRGAGVRILGELGVEFSGAIASASGAYAIDRGVKHALPGGFVSLLTTGLMGLAAKMETARLLAGIGNIDTQAIEHLSAREWLDREISQPGTRQLVQALFRVTTYANDPERQSAGAVLRQAQMALAGGVYYLDGGWQTLVSGLRAAAEKSGVKIVTGARVTEIERDQQKFLIHTADGTTFVAASVIIAAGPAEACALVKDGGNTVLNEWEQAAIPVKAACLDLALEYLPQPRARFALGIDEPLYFSVHSATAKLAPAGGALIHAAKYLGPDASTDPKLVERELEQTLDLVQPGWRKAVVERRFLPKMTVTNALVTAAQGGLAGRPGPAVPGIDGLYVAGDWVGPEGQLADASFASARLAVEMIAQGQHRAAAA